jgi:hypothetical protein
MTMTMMMMMVVMMMMAMMMMMMMADVMADPRHRRGHAVHKHHLD